MKKLFCILLAVLMFSAAFAEGNMPAPEGKWYVNQVIIDGKTYDVSMSSNKTIVEFEDSNAGVIYSTLDPEKKSMMWMGNSSGISVMGPLYGSENILLNGSFRDDELVLSEDHAAYVLNRTTSSVNYGIPYGMCMEFAYAVPEDAALSDEELTDRITAIIVSRLNRSGYTKAYANRTDDGTIRVKVEDTQDESLADLLTKRGKLEFKNPSGEIFMTGDMVQSAEYYYADGDHQVAFELTEEGAAIFADETARDIGMEISIWLDDEMLIAPTVQTPITNGYGIINGLGSRERANRIAVQIQSGVLPVELKLLWLIRIYDVPGTHGITVEARDRERESQIIALRLGDDVVTKTELKEKIEAKLEETALLYSFYGMSYDPTSEEARREAQETVINELKEGMALNAKIRELNLDDLSEEDLDQIRENARKTYDEDLEMVKAYYLTDEELQLEGDALREAAVNRLAAMGYEYESYEETARTEFMSNRIREYIVKDVAVTDEDIQEEYDRRVDADKEQYADNAGAWADASVNGTTLYYAPAGVRRIKNILIKFTDDDQEQLDTGNDAPEILEAAYSHIDEEADRILADLAAGADWDTLMAAKTQDPGMQGNSDMAVHGYAVAAGMTRFDPAFVDAAMALEKVGDISGKIRSEYYGYYIIRYAYDEPEGAVALDNVRDTIVEELLADKQAQTYHDTVKQWTDEAAFEINLDGFSE